LILILYWDYTGLHCTRKNLLFIGTLPSFIEFLSWKLDTTRVDKHVAIDTSALSIHFNVLLLLLFLAVMNDSANDDRCSNRDCGTDE